VLLISCGKKENAKTPVKNKDAKKVTNKIIRKNETKKSIQPINNTTTQITKKATVKVEQVKKKTDELLNAMKGNKKPNLNKNQEKTDLLKIDWRNIQDDRERYSWALKVKEFKEGKQMALDALASLTNSSDLTFSTLSYRVFARNAGENGDMNKVKELLEDSERKLGLNPNERDEIISNLSNNQLKNLASVWEMRAALARTLGNQKFKGQYDSNIDNHPESYWHELRLKWFPYKNNYKATIYADLAYALMKEGEKDKAIKELGNAINYLKNCKESAFNKKRLKEYKEVQKQFISGFNGAPGRYYW